MLSNTRKKDKYIFDMIWCVFMGIVACLMVYLNYTTSFWTYSMVLYAIPVFINIIFFIGIYDCFKDKNDFDQSYKKHFDVTEVQFLENYYKGFKISMIIMKVIVCLLVLSMISLLALSFTKPDLLKDSSFRLISYGIYYFLFLLGALLEKTMTKSFSTRTDKEYFKRKEGLKNE